MVEWTINKKAEERIRNGHFWVFANDVTRGLKSAKPGEVVKLLAKNGRAVATGFGNPHSLIAFRKIEVEPESSFDGPSYCWRAIQAAISPRATWPSAAPKWTSCSSPAP